MWRLLTTAFESWLNHRSPRLGAALAYYAVFSMGPLLLIVIVVAGLFFDKETVTKALNTQFSSLIGPNGARALDAMREGAASTSTGKAASIVGIILLIVAAIGVVAQLKDALNTIWEVDERKEGGFWPFIRTYIVSMAGIMALGFLLATSLVLSTALASVSRFFPESSVIGQAAELVVSFIVLTGLFGALFKYFPDTAVSWSECGSARRRPQGFSNSGSWAYRGILGRRGLRRRTAQQRLWWCSSSGSITPLKSCCLERSSRAPIRNAMSHRYAPLVNSSVGVALQMKGPG